MARVVKEVAPKFSSSLSWETVETGKMAGAKRYMELTKTLGRPAPVPALFINGSLTYDSIPDPEELEALLERLTGELGK